VQSRALEGDGGQELLLADAGDIDDLLDPGKTEGVAADAIGVQQCQFATATARLWFGTASCSAVLPALLFMISASGLVMSPGQPRARATSSSATSSLPSLAVRCSGVSPLSFWATSSSSLTLRTSRATSGVVVQGGEPCYPGESWN